MIFVYVWLVIAIWYTEFWIKYIPVYIHIIRLICEFCNYVNVFTIVVVIVVPVSYCHYTPIPCVFFSSNTHGILYIYIQCSQILMIKRKKTVVSVEYAIDITYFTSHAHKQLIHLPIFERLTTFQSFEYFFLDDCFFFCLLLWLNGSRGSDEQNIFR